MLALITGDRRRSAFPVLREIVSGPNLDADRMDYLLRDGYFTGVVSGRYDADQLIGALRVIDATGRPVLGVDGRGVVALESFVLARYMMFSTVYFHHTTRQFERILHAACANYGRTARSSIRSKRFWSGTIFACSTRCAPLPSAAGRALRERQHAVRARRRVQCRARSLDVRSAAASCWSSATATRSGPTSKNSRCTAFRWASRRGPTVLVQTRTGLVDARQVSDLIARLSGNAYWRKLYVLRERADVTAARASVRRGRLARARNAGPSPL